MKLLHCTLRENDCFKAGRTIVPKGVMVHSTGANNPMLRRYVQPTADDPDRESLLCQLGVNANGNHWNRGGVNACVHGFIGRLADGRAATVNTLPWNCRGWHAGTGTSGRSANDSHISFEICEDGLADPEYFDLIWQEAVELTAYLCSLYGLDPLGPGVVIDHSEGYGLGIASNHGDVAHWFSRFGRTMDDLRAQVAAELRGEDMTEEKFDQMMNGWLARRAAEQPAPWSETERAWAEQMGLIRGDGAGSMNYRSFCTREELAAIIYRLEHPEDIGN